NGGSTTINNIPLGTTCTITENTSSPPVLPPDACPPNEVATRSAPTYSPSSVVIGATPVTVTITNRWTCKATPPPERPRPNVCPPPKVQGPAPGVCVCPEGMVPEGNECVRRNVHPIECGRPLIPNAAGTACVCAGDMLRK